MTKPDALVLRGDGINCEEETVYALKLSQFNPVRVTCLDLKEQPTLLKRAQVIVFPGGFSFGDEVRSGKVLAVKLRAYLQEALCRAAHAWYLQRLSGAGATGHSSQWPAFAD